MSLFPLGRKRDGLPQITVDWQDQAEAGAARSSNDADLRHPLLASNSHAAKSINYVFHGKLSLFPAFVLLLGGGAGTVVFHGQSQGGSNVFEHYFVQGNVSAGIIGIVVFALAFFILVMLLIWLVCKITFTLTKDQFIVKKSGVFRSSTVRFALSEVTLHYYRTHFNEDDSWLEFVVQEHSVFYRIFGLKGNGNQKGRFFKLFNCLQDELRHYQRLYGASSVHTRRKAKPVSSTEIISREEVMILHPFAARLFGIAMSPAVAGGGAPRVSTPLCIDDIPVVSYNRTFFSHFGHSKEPGARVPVARRAAPESLRRHRRVHPL